MKNIVIITAGGSGTRILSKKKKQFINIKGRPLLFWTIDKFASHPEIDQIIIVLPQNDIVSYKDLLEKEYPKTHINVIAGGNKRQQSVYNALNYCPKDTGLVLIHDGVRPFVSQNEISQLIAKAHIKKSVIPVVKVKNTIKKIEQDKIVKTFLRDDLVTALTPQIFQYEIIKQCHLDAKNLSTYFTDDASLLEYFGHTVFTLECSANNFKITDLFDLEIAKHIIENNLLGEDTWKLKD